MVRSVVCLLLLLALLTAGGCGGVSVRGEQAVGIGVGGKR